MVKFDIVLVRDNDGVEQIYRPGSVVEGYIALELSSPQNIKSEFILTKYSVEILEIFLYCNRIFGCGITEFVIATEYSNCKFCYFVRILQ